MKANSKKLLSLLMAVAMVLSMAPAISLQAEAAIDANTVCDACGVAPAGGWTEITSTSQITAAGHYYFSGDLEVTAKSGLNFAISSGAACLNLNGATLNNPTSGTSYRTLSCTAGTLNVMGSGTVKSANTSKTGTGGAIYAAGGTINLYGGTYTTGNKDYTVFAVLSNGTLNVYNATVTLGTMGIGSVGGTINVYSGTLPCAIRCGSAIGTVNIYGGDFSGSTRGIVYTTAPASLTITGGTFSADPSSYVPSVSCYSVANNTVSASHTKADGDAGTVVTAGSCTVDGKVKFTCSVEGCGAEFYEVTEAPGHDFGDNGATCATCGEANPDYVSLPTTCPCGATGLTAADWTELPATGFGVSVTEHNHYYVAEDTTITSTGNSIQLGADQCLYLTEGTTLTNNGRIRSRSGYAIHIWGEGNYVRPDSECEYGMFEGSASNAIYIHGGNWTYSDPDVDVVSGTIIVDGGTFNFDPSAYVVDGYKATETDGIWTVAEVVAHDCVWDDGVQTQAPTCTVEGVMTYTCTVDGCGETYTQPITKLDHDFSGNTPTCANCSEANPNYVELPSVCPGCGETVTEWTAVTSAPGDSGWTADMSGHYYLANDIVGTAKRVWSIPEGAEVCLHLNGNDITSDATTSGAIALRVYGTVRLMGEGTVSTGTNTVALAPVGVYATGVVEVYGGTYLAENNEIAVRSIADGSSITIYGGTHSKVGAAYIPSGYEATENTDGTWTVAKLNLPTHCSMCDKDVTQWIPVTAASGDSGWTADMSGHYYLANDIVGTAKRVFSFPAGTEVCLYLNGHDITGSVVNTAPVALRTYGTLRIGGEGTVSTPNVTDAGDGTTWSVVAASGEGAVVEIYGGTYIDGADRDRTVRAADGATLTVYGGSFSDEITGFVAENKWCLPKADMWYVEDLTAAAIITESGYTTYETTEAAVAAYTEGYILMGSADSIELTKDAVVDSNDKQNIVVTGTGTLSPVGGGSWDLTNANVSYDATNPVTGQRYLTVEGNTYKFTMKVNKVVLRPGTTAETLGIYYKTQIVIGDALANLIDSYGVALSLVEMPTAEDILAVDSHALYTVVDNDLVAGENNVNSGLLKNILKETNTPEENTTRGEMPVYANAYIAIDLDGDGNLDYVMADVEDNNIQHSLKSLMGKVDAMTEIPQVAIDCYKAWKALGMGDWGLTNLDAAAYPAE